MNITLTGNLGAGKSSVCKEFKNMGYNIISTGTIFRDIAKEKGISVVELNEMAKQSREIDDMIDNRSIELGKTLDNTIFDSRMAWNFVPDSFKVFLLIDPTEAANRVLNDNTRDTEKYSTLEESYNNLNKRAELEKERFKKLYNVDYYDLNNYNLVIESTYATPTEIADEIIRNFKLYQKQKFNQVKIELNTKMLYPTQNFRDFNNDRIAECIASEKNNNSKCALEKVPVAIQNGYNYLLDGHHRTFSAINQGKVFTEVDIFNTRQPIIPMQTKELYDFEDIFNFRYKFYPDLIDKKADYIAKFPIVENIKNKDNEMAQNKDNIELD